MKSSSLHTSASSKVYIAKEPSRSLARLPTECITISWHLSTPPIIIPYSTFIKPSPFFYIQSTDTSQHEQIQWTPTRNFWKLISILWWISKLGAISNAPKFCKNISFVYRTHTGLCNLKIERSLWTNFYFHKRLSE